MSSKYTTEYKAAMAKTLHNIVMGEKHVTPTIADTVNEIIARQKPKTKKEKKMQHAQQRTMTLNEQEYVDQVPLTVRMYILRLEKQNAALVAVVKEFVADIEAVGVDEVETDWPDLVPTYHHAKAALAAAKK